MTPIAGSVRRNLDFPGFVLDEPVDEIGRPLKLPPQHEPRRKAIEASLPELTLYSCRRSIQGQAEQERAQQVARHSRGTAQEGNCGQLERVTTIFVFDTKVAADIW